MGLKEHEARERNEQLRNARLVRVSAKMAELQGEHQKQKVLMQARHNNEKIDLLEKQAAERAALLEEEAKTAPPAPAPAPESDGE